MPQIPRNPRFWLGALLLWFVVLWVCSSFAIGGNYTPPIKHFDKIEHFAYFFGGSGLLCAGLFRMNPARPNWNRIIVTAILVIALVGWLDEYHQTFTLGRSGNDPLDWLADVLGATAGAFLFKGIHHWVK